MKFSKNNLTTPLKVIGVVLESYRFCGIVVVFQNVTIFLPGSGSRSRSRRRKDSEVFGWSRIPDNTGSESRIFCPTPTPDVQLDHFLHHTHKLQPVEMVQFRLKLLLKQRFLAVYHDFHCFQQPNSIPFMFTGRIRVLEISERPESEISERLDSESDILLPTPQP